MSDLINASPEMSASPEASAAGETVCGTTGGDNNITLAEAARMILAADNIVILAHARPDGDTIGSCYALSAALFDKTRYVVCGDPLPDRLAFISGGEPCYLPDTLPADFTPGLIVSLDTAGAALAGSAEALARRADLKIDHHPMGDSFARFHYVDSTVSACGEIIFDLLCAMRRLLPCSANALYAAIVSDSGSFKYSSVSSLTLNRAAALLELGADHTAVSEKLFESKSLREVAAVRLAYNQLRFSSDGRLASVLVTNDAKREAGLTDEDLGIINSLPRGIEGVDLGVVIKQTDGDPGLFRISMRSSERVAANALCALFGGGGHLRAAGGSITASSPEEAERQVLDAVTAALVGKLSS